MDVGGSSAQGGDLRLNESMTLREIANEAREKAMYERMEQMEKHTETLTTILHERVAFGARGSSGPNY
ncbi:hypothetical protein WN943_001657 [Citrus x changshan-huyou]